MIQNLSSYSTETLKQMLLDVDGRKEFRFWLESEVNSILQARRGKCKNHYYDYGDSCKYCGKKAPWEK